MRRSEESNELLNSGSLLGTHGRELAELTEWFQGHTLQELDMEESLGGAPIVIEVTFDRFQESKRHKSGYALRFPDSSTAYR